MSARFEYATTTAMCDAIKAEQLVPVQPRGDGWEMCGSSAVPGAPRGESVEDEGRYYTFKFSTIRALWFWKREVSR